MHTIAVAFLDALPAIIAFVVVSILTFIGWVIRRGVIIAGQVHDLLEVETKPNGGASTKDQLMRIGDLLNTHHEWAQEDAAKIAEHLGVEDDG